MYSLTDGGSYLKEQSPYYASWKVNGIRSRCRQVGNSNLAPNRAIVCYKPLLPPTMHPTYVLHPKPLPDAETDNSAQATAATEDVQSQSTTPS